MAGIIKQPDGKYCLFCGNIDNITHYNMSEQDIVDLKVKESRRTIELEVRSTIDMLDKDKKPYHQFTMNYEEILETIESVHGKGEKDKVSEVIRLQALDNTKASELAWRKGKYYVSETFEVLQFEGMMNKKDAYFGKGKDKPTAIIIMQIHNKGKALKETRSVEGVEYYEWGGKT